MQIITEEAYNWPYLIGYDITKCISVLFVHRWGDKNTKSLMVYVANLAGGLLIAKLLPLIGHMSKNAVYQDDQLAETKIFFLTIFYRPKTCKTN